MLETPQKETPDLNTTRMREKVPNERMTKKSNQGNHILDEVFQAELILPPKKF